MGLKREYLHMVNNARGKKNNLRREHHTQHNNTPNEKENDKKEKGDQNL